MSIFWAEVLSNKTVLSTGFGQIVPSQSPARASPASNISSNLPDLSSPPPPLPLNNSSLTANHLTGKDKKIG